ncbi:MAG: UDP-N-acetylglucosamine pyrophosphorylase [Eubacteriales bacterium]|nr:UDP-N-acetylglucosamine pyrophosphorylase [Clostridiales bacterium]MDY5836413.1 UDP-N-acetylglucosamine pyrophosphorylase [Eubacteriales bacterium]
MFDTNAAYFFDLQDTWAKDLLDGCNPVWEALPALRDFILKLQGQLNLADYQIIGQDQDVYVHRSAQIAPSCVLQGPSIIGPGVELRPNVFIRSTALIEAGATVGFSVEIKNALLLPGANLAHFNYCGDSILGKHAHLGAGAITSNLKSDHSLVTIQSGTEKLPTGLKKFGAIIGDQAEIGCNAVLNPGSLIGPASRVYPLSMFRGYLPTRHIFKQNGQIIALQ